MNRESLIRQILALQIDSDYISERNLKNAFKLIIEKPKDIHLLWLYKNILRYIFNYGIDDFKNNFLLDIKNIKINDYSIVNGILNEIDYICQKIISKKEIDNELKFVMKYSNLILDNKNASNNKVKSIESKNIDKNSKINSQLINIEKKDDIVNSDNINTVDSNNKNDNNKVNSNNITDINNESNKVNFNNENESINIEIVNKKNDSLKNMDEKCDQKIFLNHKDYKRTSSEENTEFINDEIISEKNNENDTVIQENNIIDMQPFKDENVFLYKNFDILEIIYDLIEPFLFINTKKVVDIVVYITKYTKKDYIEELLSKFKNRKDFVFEILIIKIKLILNDIRNLKRNVENYNNSEFINNHECSFDDNKDEKNLKNNEIGDDNKIEQENNEFFKINKTECIKYGDYALNSYVKNNEICLINELKNTIRKFKDILKLIKSDKNQNKIFLIESLSHYLKYINDSDLFNLYFELAKDKKIEIRMSIIKNISKVRSKEVFQIIDYILENYCIGNILMYIYPLLDLYVSKTCLEFYLDHPTPKYFICFFKHHPNHLLDLLINYLNSDLYILTKDISIIHDIIDSIFNIQNENNDEIINLKNESKNILYSDKNLIKSEKNVTDTVDLKYYKSLDDTNKNVDDKNIKEIFQKTDNINKNRDIDVDIKDIKNSINNFLIKISGASDEIRRELLPNLHILNYYECKNIVLENLTKNMIKWRYKRDLLKAFFINKFEIKNLVKILENDKIFSVRMYAKEIKNCLDQ